MHVNTLQVYYLATPVFFILHFIFDINLRISIPGAHDSWLYMYYALCFVAGFIAFNTVITGAVFSLIESTINILLLLLSVLMPIYNIGHVAGENGGIAFGLPELVHFFIAGSILLVSFYQNPLIAFQGSNK